ncbi:hypothetical protein SteCoe_5000 [Stentor coeruleus]|uniref:Uncharacterized protein n=1 Tax=Stentor coeruleus TaxID=5963 RepID=A0A1R2CTA7_9CILI|nr:hypothetical protein SteCoe_5000 [Stentor coeruleus]
MAKFNINSLGSELYKVSSSTRNSPVYEISRTDSIEAIKQNLIQAVETITSLRQENNKIRQNLQSKYENQIKNFEQENRYLKTQILLGETHKEKPKESKKNIEHLKSIISDKELIIKLQEGKLVEIKNMVKAQMQEVKDMVEQNKEMQKFYNKNNKQANCGICEVEENFKDFFVFCRNFKKFSVYQTVKNNLGCYEVIQKRIQKNKCCKIVKSLISLSMLLIPMAVGGLNSPKKKTIFTQTMISSSLNTKSEIDNFSFNSKSNSINTNFNSITNKNPSIVPDPCISLDSLNIKPQKRQILNTEKIRNPFETNSSITQDKFSLDLQLKTELIQKKVKKRPSDTEKTFKFENRVVKDLEMIENEVKNIKKIPKLDTKNESSMGISEKTQSPRLGYKDVESLEKPIVNPPVPTECPKLLESPTNTNNFPSKNIEKPVKLKETLNQSSKSKILILESEKNENPCEEYSDILSNTIEEEPCETSFDGINQDLISKNPEKYKKPKQKLKKNNQIKDFPRKSTESSNQTVEKIVSSIECQDHYNKAINNLKHIKLLNKGEEHFINNNISKKKYFDIKKNQELIKTINQRNIRLSKIKNEISSTYSQEESEFFSSSPSIEDQSPRTNSPESSRAKRSKWNFSGLINLKILQNQENDPRASQPPPTIPEIVKKKRTNRSPRLTPNHDVNRFTEYMRPTLKEEGTWVSVKDFFACEESQRNI